MNRNPVLYLLAILFLLLLAGCSFDSSRALYALPKSSEAYVELQSRISAVKGDAPFLSPMSGENRQTIQLVDVDNDGNLEAVTFYKVEGDEKPLKIAIFKLDDRDKYQLYAKIEGAGTNIESIEYTNLGFGCDLLVSWQVSPHLRTLVAYTITDGTPVELMRSGFERYLTADLDEDGIREVVLAQSTEQGPWRIEYYRNQEGGLSLSSTSPLSDSTSGIKTWSAGRIQDGSALFITSYLGGDRLITDVFVPVWGNLQNISLGSGTGISINIYHNYAGLAPKDMTGDGLTEVPQGVYVPAYGNSATPQFSWLKWVDFRLDGTFTHLLSTYHAGDGSWYLELPGHWEGSFSMQTKEDNAAGIRSVTFARGTEADGITPEPFLTITRLVGGNRTENAKKGNRFILYSDSTTIFTGELVGTWDCGLTKDDLIARFHPDTVG